MSILASAEISNRSVNRFLLIDHIYLVAALASWPDFHGTREEDPVKYVQMVDNILDDANIRESAKTKVVETQFENSVREWYSGMMRCEIRICQEQSSKRK